MKIDSIRKEYNSARLRKSFMDMNPFRQFSAWLAEAIGAGNPEPTAMTLSTNGKDGFPQSRTVLLKFTDEAGFTFFTNYSSRKGADLDKDPRVALHFFWPELHRQVRVTGIAEKTDLAVSDAYFHSRPRNSQIGAWASQQSQEAESREALDNQFEYYSSLFDGQEVPRPDHWGGYQVVPVTIEFWQGRENRMHDRIIYEKHGNRWQKKRLSP